MNLKCNIHSQLKRENGYELYLTVYDKDTGLDILGNQTVSVGKEFLSGPDIESFLTDKYLPKVERLLSMPEDDEVLIPKKDVEEMLVDKGYLKENEKLEDLPEKSKDKEI